MKRQTKTQMATVLAGVLAFWSCGSAEQRPPGMALVPAGRHTPLFRSESEPKDVSVPAFLLDEYPVTNAEFVEFVRANPKWRRSQVKRPFADADYLKAGAGD